MKKKGQIIDVHRSEQCPCLLMTCFCTTLCALQTSSCSSIESSSIRSGKGPSVEQQGIKTPRKLFSQTGTSSSGELWNLLDNPVLPFFLLKLLYLFFSFLFLYSMLFLARQPKRRLEKNIVIIMTNIQQSRKIVKKVREKIRKRIEFKQKGMQPAVREKQRCISPNLFMWTMYTLKMLTLMAQISMFRKEKIIENMGILKL